jgi:hypothetical protein
MRKLILVLAFAVVAVLAIPATASAGVHHCRPFTAYSKGFRVKKIGCHKAKQVISDFIHQGSPHLVSLPPTRLADALVRVADYSSGVPERYEAHLDHLAPLTRAVSLRAEADSPASSGASACNAPASTGQHFAASRTPS